VYHPPHLNISDITHISRDKLRRVILDGSVIGSNVQQVARLQFMLRLKSMQALYITRSKLLLVFASTSRLEQPLLAKNIFDTGKLRFTRSRHEV
jgi:hypothetical protein